MPSRLDLKGKIFGRLTVIEFFGRDKNKHIIWLCRCSCANASVVKVSVLLLRSGKTKSCGCFKREYLTKVKTTHGMSKTRIYSIWCGIVKRCMNVKSLDYPNYGGRGIKVCDRWMKFEGFYKDVGEFYNKHVEEFGEKNTTAERSNVNGNYEPTNFIWATQKQQAQTKRNSVMSVDFSQHLNFKDQLQRRLNRYIKQNIDSQLFFDSFGIDLPGFKKYIESLFLPGMTWENHGSCRIGDRVWQFDHIIPINRFDLSNEVDRQKCFYYTNYQPLWWEDNMKKVHTDVLKNG